MELLSLLNNLPDVLPLDLLLTILKDMLCLQGQQNISPLDHMGFDVVYLDELQDG